MTFSPAIILLCTAVLWSGDVPALELGAVLKETAVSPPALVHFREERGNPLLKEPMILTGYFEYLGTGHFRKVVETPFDEEFQIKSGQIEITRDGETQALSLNKARPLQAMLTGIEAILAGDQDSIERNFNYELSGDTCAWSLQLEPLRRSIARHLAAIRVNGLKGAITSILLTLEGNEWQRIEILGEKATQ